MKRDCRADSVRKARRITAGATALKHRARNSKCKIFDADSPAMAGCLAERVGFEPTWSYCPQRISSPRRYGHFGTSPFSKLLHWNPVLIDVALSQIYFTFSDVSRNRLDAQSGPAGPDCRKAARNGHIGLSGRGPTFPDGVQVLLFLKKR